MATTGDGAARRNEMVRSTPRTGGYQNATYLTGDQDVVSSNTGRGRAQTLGGVPRCWLAES